MLRNTTTAALLAGIVPAGFLSTVPARGSDPLLIAPWRAFDTGDHPTFGPHDLAIGDLDADGIPDVVASRDFFGGPGLTVLRGLGDGSYAEPQIYELPVTQSLGEVALADIDGDGDLDAVALLPDAQRPPTRIGLWRNNGDGTFAPHTEFAAGEGPQGLVIGDFTGDGFPDVVTADYGSVGSGTSDTISLMRHNSLQGPQAGFLAPVHFTVGDNSYRLAAADVDGDQDLDLAVGRAAFTGDHGIAIVLNDGAGTFTIHDVFEQVPGGSNLQATVVLADMDNDGDPDLLTAGAFNGFPKIALRRNDGAGQFGPVELLGLGLWSITPRELAVADVNGDGWLDVLGAMANGRRGDGWNAVLSNGAGGFHPGVKYPSSKQTFDVATADADGDGDLDVLALANDASVVAVHENLGAGSFPTLVLYDLAVLTDDLEHGDIDNDGDLDVVTSDGFVRILRNLGDGTFAPAAQYTAPIAPGELKLRDFNNDGFLDLLIGPDGAGHFAVALNDTNGGFLPGVVTGVGTSQRPHIGAFDLDGDGDLDVVLADTGPAQKIHLARNNGDGTSFSLMQPISTPGLAWRIGGADLDHDGNVDLLSGTALGITVFPGNGDFTFGDEIPLSEAAYDFVLTDFDLDGNHDLGVLLPQDSFGTVYIGTMMGYGDLSFEFATIYPGPNGRESPYRIANEIGAADVDGDGFPDLVTCNNAPNDVSVFLGNGDGTLQPQQRYGAGYSASFLALGDFSGDGRLDIGTVVSIPPSGLDDALVVLYGNPPPSSGVPAQLDDFDVVFGSHVSGGLSEIAFSDDATLRTRSAFGFTAFEPNLMEIVIGATNASESASSFDIAIESRINNSSGTAKVRFRNWSSNQFEQVAQYPIDTTEQTVVIEDVAAADRVRTSDGRIELSVKHAVIATFSLAGFDSFFDWVELVVH